MKYSTKIITALCFIVLSAACTVKAKTGVPRLELIETATAVCIGTATDYREAGDQRTAAATLHVLVWIKGSGPDTAQLIFRFTPAPQDEAALGQLKGDLSADPAVGKVDEVALWQLMGDPATGKLIAYPWARIAPLNWINLPTAWRAKVLKAVDYSASRVVDGLKLHLMRMPFFAGVPLDIWAIIENTTDKPLFVYYYTPNCLSLRVSEPAGDDTTTSFPSGAQDGTPRLIPIPPHTPLLLGTYIGGRGPLPLVKATQPGKYKIEATFEIKPLEYSARASPVNEPPTWFGKLTATLEATLVAPPLATSGDGGFTLAQARTAAEKHGSETTNPAKSLVRNVAEITAPELATLFPGSRFFSVDVFNPESRIAGPPTLASAVVARAAEVTFLTSDEEVTRFLSKRATPAATKADALRIATAFFALRSYEIRTSPVHGEAKPKENWTTEVKKDGEVWTVSLVAMVDKYIKYCRRYSVTISAKGEVAATAGNQVGMASGGYE